MWSPADLDRRDGTVSEQVSALVVRRVERGDLSVGSALPSERELARRLSVSRASVVRALGMLRATGVVATRHGAGSVVAPSDRLLDPVAPTTPASDATIDLRSGTTAAPYEVEVAAARIAGLSLHDALAGDGPPPGGSPQLRAALAGWLSGEGVPTLPTQLMITTGAGASLELLLQLLVRGPGTAITESPTYPAALATLRRHRLAVTGWPAGATGWDPDQLTSVVRRVRPAMAYLQADNHNPTGHSLPAATRGVVAETLARHGVPLVCDETLRPLWFGPGDQPAALSGQRGVLSVGSLSKSVWGGLRIGWVRASQDMTRRLHGLPGAAFLAPSAFDELLAAEILPSMSSIVARRRRLLSRNWDTLRSELSHVPALAWEPPTGGMTVWLELLDADPQQVATSARRLGLLVTPGAAFTPDGVDRRHLRVPFTLPPTQLGAAVALLGRALLAGGYSAWQRTPAATLR